MRLRWNDSETEVPEPPPARDLEEVAPSGLGLRWGRSLAWAREAQAPADPLDEVVMLKPFTRRQIENRRTYIRAYMQRYREKKQAAHLSLIESTPKTKGDNCCGVGGDMPAQEKER